MTRCKPLLGTLVEISIDSTNPSQQFAIDQAFSAIAKVQNLMGFHHPQSELSKINACAHLQEIEVHPWTAQVLRAAIELHSQSNGLFNCGIGYRLVQAGLLPKHVDLAQRDFGGIENLQFLDSHLIISSKPLCLDLGGIAKGFAVDIAVSTLQSNGIQSGCVNAGGDLRVFGEKSKTIQIRNPASAWELIDIGKLQNGSIATSSLYFSKRDQNSISYVVDPLNDKHVDFSCSYSIIAEQCIYADALTKVLAISDRTDHPCFAYFSAQAIRIDR